MGSLRILDLFCGMGGWSIPFIEDGDDVVGIDIKNQGYPGELIVQDIRTLDGHRYTNYDLIIGSPPCNHFSTASRSNKTQSQKSNPDPNKGLELISHFHRIVEEAQPRCWIMENVRESRHWIKDKPIWSFYIGSQGVRYIWGNIQFQLTPEYRFPNRILQGFRGRYYADMRGVKALSGREYAKIPYPIACIVRDTINMVTEP